MSALTQVSLLVLLTCLPQLGLASNRNNPITTNKIAYKVGGIFTEDDPSLYALYEESLSLLSASAVSTQSKVKLLKYEQDRVVYYSVDPVNILSELCQNDRLDMNTVAILTVCDSHILSFLTMVAAQLHIPLISLTDRHWTYSFKDIHPMLLRLVPSMAAQSEPIIKLLKQYGLYTFAVITTFDRDSDGFLNAIEALTVFSPEERQQWKLQIVTVDPDDYNNISLSLKEIKNNGDKVFVLHTELDDAMRVLEKAGQLNLVSAGYAWILTEQLYTAVSTADRSGQLPDGLITLEYVDTTEVAGGNKLAARFQKATRLIQDTLNQMDDRTLQLLQRTGVKQACDPGSDPAEAGNTFYRGLKNATYLNRRVFTDAGDLAEFRYYILNLQTRADNKQWEKIGDFRNGQFSNFHSVVWPGSSFQTPREGTDMGSVRVTAKETKPFVEALKAEDKNWECYSASRCLKPNTHEKLDLIRLFDETGKYTPSMYDLLLPTKADFDRLNQTGSVSPRFQLTQDMLQCCSGLMVDFLNKLKKDLEFNYYLYIVDKNKPGSKKNGSWDGMVRDLINGAADMAIGAFSITKERSEVIDFTTPFFHSGFSIMVARKKPYPKADAFLAPLSWEVWILVVVCVHVVALCITAFEWLSPYGLTPLGRKRDKVFSWPSALVHTWSMLFSHTFPSKAPKCWSARWLVNIWGCFSFVFIASYTANLAAFMAGIMQHLDVENIYSPIFQKPTGQVKFATVNGSSTDNYIKLNWERMHKFMKDFNSESIPAAINQIKGDQLDAFIYDSPIITYEVATDSDCRLLTVGAPFGGEGYGIGLPKGSHLNKPISTLIQNYTSGTFMEELMDKWFRGAGSKGCFKPTRNEQVGLGLNHAMGLFFFFSCGVIFAVICLIFEIVTYKWLVPYMRTKPQHSKWRDLMVYSQRLHRAVNKDEHVTPKELLNKMLSIVRQRQFSKAVFKENDIKRTNAASNFINGAPHNRKVKLQEGDGAAAAASEKVAFMNDISRLEKPGGANHWSDQPPPAMIPMQPPASNLVIIDNNNYPSEHMSRANRPGPPLSSFAPNSDSGHSSSPVNKTSILSPHQYTPPISLSGSDVERSGTPPASAAGLIKPFISPGRQLSRDSCQNQAPAPAGGSTPNNINQTPQSILKKRDPRKQFEEIQKEFSDKFDEALRGAGGGGGPSGGTYSRRTGDV